MCGHTPGPWIADKDDEFLFGARRTIVADLFSNAGPLEREANRKLLAAAPEMWEFCRKVALAGFSAVAEERLPVLREIREFVMRMNGEGRRGA